MIDVRVRADDRQNLQLMAPQNLEDAIDFIARIDNDRFFRCFVSKHRAVALQDAHRQDFVYQSGSSLSIIPFRSNYYLFFTIKA